MKEVAGKYFALLLVSVLLAVSSCKKDDRGEGNVRIEFVLKNQGQDLVLNENFEFTEGYTARLNAFRFYVSHLRLYTGNDEEGIKEYDLINFSNGDRRNTSLSGQVPAGTYSGLRFGIGLDEQQNSSSPASFPVDHPLSSSQGTYWTWASKYRFLIFEGRVNETEDFGSGSDVLWSYHTGTDTLYTEKDIAGDFRVRTSGNEVITLSIEFEDLFDGPGGSVDFIDENQTHTEASDFDIAEKLTYNFAGSIEREGG